jgi:hypothetical protein
VFSSKEGATGTLKHRGLDRGGWKRVFRGAWDLDWSIRRPSDGMDTTAQISGLE